MMLHSVAIVCISSRYHQIGIDAYISPSSTPFQSYRSTHQHTELYSTAPTTASTSVVNRDSRTSVTGLATHEHHLHSTTKSTSLFNVGYDANAIINYYDNRPWEVGLRLNMLGLPLLGWYLGLVMDDILKINGKESVERKRGEELRMHFVRSQSVALIKSGQALSLRPDLLKSKIWAEELGKLVDEVGSFPDVDALNIMREELSDLLPAVKNARLAIDSKQKADKQRTGGRKSRLTRLVENDPILSLFEFDNDVRTVASASIGQVVS